MLSFEHVFAMACVSVIAMTLHGCGSDSCKLGKTDCAGVNAVCCTAANAEIDLQKKAMKDITAAAGNTEKITKIGADMQKAMLAEVAKCTDLPSTVALTPCMKKEMPSPSNAAPTSESCKLGKTDCAGVNAVCCTAANAEIDLQKKAQKDITAAAGNTEKITKINADMQKAMLAEAAKCTDVPSNAALTSCRAKANASTLMVAEEPPKILAGFCGFLAGAFVVGLAASLKKRSHAAMEQPLNA